MFGAFLALGCSKRFFTREDAVGEEGFKQRTDQYQNLIREKAEEKAKQQEEMGGLVINKAFYGDLKDQALQYDVTIPLQFLVEEEKLELDKESKQNIMGFYKYPQLEEKDTFLYVEYTYKRLKLFACVRNNEELKIPPLPYFQINQYKV